MSFKLPEPPRDKAVLRKQLQAPHGRAAFGILQNGYLLNSGEAMNLLSLIRLGIDLGIFADGQRAVLRATLELLAERGHDNRWTWDHGN